MTISKDLMANLLLTAGGRGGISTGGGGSSSELTNWDGTNWSGLEKSGFGVFAYYTNSDLYDDTYKPNFMYNQRVYKDDDAGVEGNWTYEPVRYWPNEFGVGAVSDEIDRVSFFAYAPFSNMEDNADPDPAIHPADYCIPSSSLAHETGDPWIVYRLIDQDNLDKQVDLLYADGRDDQLLDQTKKEYDTTKGKVGTVDITLKHALACFGEKVTITLSQKDDPDDDSEADKAKEALERLEDVELRLTYVGIDYSLTPKAKLVLWNQGEPNWQPIVSQVMAESRTVTLLDADAGDTAYTLFSRAGNVNDTSITAYDGTEGIYKWESTDNHGIFFIPVEVDGFPQTATLRVSYEVYVQGVKDDGMSKTKTATVRLSDYYDSFKLGGQRLDQVDITLTLDE